MRLQKVQTSKDTSYGHLWMSSLGQMVMKNAMVSFYVDFETQERYPKKSAHWYKKLAETQIIE